MCGPFSCPAIDHLEHDLSLQTIVQLLEAEDETLTTNIRSSPMLLAQIRELADKASSSGSQDGDSGEHNRRGSISDDDDASAEGGAGEIASLSRRILDLTEGGQVLEGKEGGEHAALRASVHQALNGEKY